MKLNSLKQIVNLDERITFVVDYLIYRLSGRKIVPFSSMVMNLHGLKFLTRPKTVDYWFGFEHYEPEFTKFMMAQKGRTFLDIGSHIGRYSLLLSRNFEKVIAFEPIKSNFEQLKKNIATNGIKNIEVINKGLYNEESELDMTICDSVGNTGGCSLYFDNSKVHEKVKLITLDSLNLKGIDLIKIDVEGVEFDVLEGAKETIKREKPIIIIESFKIIHLALAMFNLDYIQVPINVGENNYLFKKKVIFDER